jgi:hypothetical protein
MKIDFIMFAFKNSPKNRSSKKITPPSVVQTHYDRVKSSNFSLLLGKFKVQGLKFEVSYGGLLFGGWGCTPHGECSSHKGLLI